MDLVHSFPFGKGVLQNVAAPMCWLPMSPDYKVWENGNTKFRWGQSWKLQSSQAQVEQSTCLTTSKLRVTRQIRKQLMYLKFYCPLKCVFGQSSEVSPPSRTSPHDLLTCSGLNPNPLKARTANGHGYLHQPLNWPLSQQQFFLDFLKDL